MNQEEALELLDRVAQAFIGNRADHIKLQEAITVLRDLISKKNKKD